MLQTNIQWILIVPKLKGMVILLHVILSILVVWVKIKLQASTSEPGSWSYGCWIYNYLCNHSVPIATNIVSSNSAQARCTRYNIMW